MKPHPIDCLGAVDIYGPCRSPTFTIDQTIQLHHWLAMAKQCNFPEYKMQEIIMSVFDQMDEVRARVEHKLPNNFSSLISDAVFNGMQAIKIRCR